MCSFECWKKFFQLWKPPRRRFVFLSRLVFSHNSSASLLQSSFTLLQFHLCSSSLLFILFLLLHQHSVFLSALPLVFLFLPSSFLDFCLSFYFFFHKVQRYKDPCSLLIIESMCFQSRCNRCVKTTTQPSAFTNIYEKMHHSKDLTDSNMLDAASAASQFIKFFPPRYSAINWKWRYHKVEVFRNHIVSQSHRAPNLLWH